MTTTLQELLVKPLIFHNPDQAQNDSCDGQGLILAMLTYNNLPMTTPLEEILVKALTFVLELTFPSSL